MESINIIPIHFFFQNSKLTIFQCWTTPRNSQVLHYGIHCQELLSHSNRKTHHCYHPFYFISPNISSIIPCIIIDVFNTIVNSITFSVCCTLTLKNITDTRKLHFMPFSGISKTDGYIFPKFKTYKISMILLKCVTREVTMENYTGIQSFIDIHCKTPDLLQIYTAYQTTIIIKQIILDKFHRVWFLMGHSLVNICELLTIAEYVPY